MMKCHQACQATPLTECSSCNLAYNCAQKREGARWAWPAMTLAVLAAMALIRYVA